MGLRWEDYDYPFTGEAMAISGYPTDKGGDTMWKDLDQIRKHSDTLFWYAADTYGGQSGSPVYQSSYKCGTSTGYCAIGIHAYGTGNGEVYNHGPRLWPYAAAVLLDFADNYD